jgi:nucleotide-binding universal stress UspA family protein
MIIVKRILVPIDFGQTSAAALNYSIDLARLFGARLHLLHVFGAPTAVRECPVEPFATPPGGVRDQLTGLLSPANQRELRPVCETRFGAPTDEILDYAGKHEIDLIVMGTHGREGFAHALLGSVAETVVRKATCPVVTVHNREGAVVTKESRASWREPAAS